MAELLSPAGNIESLKSAVFNMADAVYLGLEHFNARLKADNFSTRNIKQWVEFCHFYTVKVYVTINVLVKNSELESVIECLIACENAGVDAIIVTDLALLKLSREYAPSIALHASTQMGIHNYLGAKFAERLGFKRVVLSRETTLEDVKAIKEKTSLEIEYFVHGAMCVSFSGGCLLSAIATGNSGNRGLCLQPCRKLYNNSLTDEKAYFLSPKDQCQINNLKALIDAGVDSFKIEGRLKSAEYVASVVKAYRKMLDVGVCSNTDVIDMKKTFNRGNFSNGYAISRKSEIMYKYNQSNLGVFVGKIIECRPNKKGCYDVVVKSSHKFNNCDGCKIIQDKNELGGFTVNIIKCEGDVYTLFAQHHYPKNASVNLTYDTELTKQLDLIKRQICLNLDIILSQNFLNIKTKIKTFFGEHDLNYNIKLNLETSLNAPITEIDFEKQFSKSGNTPFKLYINTKIIGNIFIPKSYLNKLRRDYLVWVENQIISMNTQPKKSYSKLNFPILNAPHLSIYLIEIGDELDLSILQLGNSDLVVNIEKIDSFIIKNDVIDNNIYIKLPKLAVYSDLEYILNKLKTLNVFKWFAGIYADNLYGAEISLQFNYKIIVGFGYNIFNNLSAETLGLKAYCVSSEFNGAELSKMNNICINYAYGYLPIMTLLHCPIINILDSTCEKCKYKPFEFIDCYGRYKVTRTRIRECVFTVRNCACHNLLREKSLENYVKYIDLNGLNKLTKGNLIDNIEKYGYISNEEKYTTGHIARGVK